MAVEAHELKLDKRLRARRVLSTVHLFPKTVKVSLCGRENSHKSYHVYFGRRYQYCGICQAKARERQKRKP